MGKIDFKTGPNSRWSGRFLYDDVPYLVTNPIDFFRTDTLSNWAQNITNTRIRREGSERVRFPLVSPAVFSGIRHSPVAENFPTSLHANWPRRRWTRPGAARLGSGLLPLGDGGNWAVPELGGQGQSELDPWLPFLQDGLPFPLQFFALLLETRSAFTSPTIATEQRALNFLLGDVTTAAQGAENRDNVHHRVTTSISGQLESLAQADSHPGFGTSCARPDRPARLSDEPRVTCVQSNPNWCRPAMIRRSRSQTHPSRNGTLRTARAVVHLLQNSWQPRVGLAYRLTRKRSCAADLVSMATSRPAGCFMAHWAGHVTRAPTRDSRRSPPARRFLTCRSRIRSAATSRGADCRTWGDSRIQCPSGTWSIGAFRSSTN